jgi:hypothetical protein
MNPKYATVVADFEPGDTAEDIDAAVLIADRDQLAAEAESDTAIKQLVESNPWMTNLHAAMVAKLAARNIRADETGTLTKARALIEASQYEFDDSGDPQVFPFDNASSDCVRAARELDQADAGSDAQYLREVAASVKDHRESFRRGHTVACRGDLYRGLCH